MVIKPVKPRKPYKRRPRGSLRTYKTHPALPYEPAPGEEVMTIQDLKEGIAEVRDAYLEDARLNPTPITQPTFITLKEHREYIEAVAELAPDIAKLYIKK